MHVFRMYWRRTLRMSGAIYLWMLIPFVFMFIYQAAFGGGGSVVKTTLAVVDEDSTFVSEFVSGAFSQGELADFIQVRNVASLDEAGALFEDGDASAALVIPEGFAEKLVAVEDVTLTLYTNPRHYIGPQIAEGVTGSLVAMGNGLLGVFAEPLRLVKKYNDENPDFDADDVANLARLFFEVGDNAPNIGAIAGIDVVTVEPESTEDDNSLGDDWNMATLFFPGLLVFGLLSVSLGLETRFLQDRLRGVTRRMVVAPLAPWSLVLQQRLYAGSFIFAIAVVSAAIGGLLWQIEPVGLITATWIAVALTLFITGINGIIFSLSNSLRATSAISSIVMIALVSVGGGFFPAEFIGSTFKGIASLTPTGMANIGLTQALTGRALEISLPVLFAYCGAFFVASVLLARRRIA
jgi:ABC-2 type transport system permease protein